MSNFTINRRASIENKLLNLMIILCGFGVISSCAIQPQRTITISVPTKEIITIPIKIYLKCGSDIHKTITVNELETMKIEFSPPCSTIAFHGTSSIRHEALFIYHPYYEFYSSNLYGIKEISGIHKPIYDFKNILKNQTIYSNNELRLILLNHFNNISTYIFMMKQMKIEIPVIIQKFIIDLYKYGIDVVEKMTSDDIENLKGYQYDGLDLKEKRNKIMIQMLAYYNNIENYLNN